jgi:hypothetical protein
MSNTRKCSKSDAEKNNSREEHVTYGCLSRFSLLQPCGKLGRCLSTLGIFQISYYGAQQEKLYLRLEGEFGSWNIKRDNTIIDIFRTPLCVKLRGELCLNLGLDGSIL